MNTLDELVLTLSSRQAANALLETAGKSFLILAAAFLLALLFRRSAAATRHFIWLGALASLLALPVAVDLTPRWSRPAWTDALLRHATAQVSGNEVPTLMTGLPAAVGASQSSTEAARSESPAPVAAAAPVAQTFPWRELILPGWAAGVVLTLLVFQERRWRLRRIERAARPVTDAEVLGLRDSVLRELDLRRKVRLLETEQRWMPMTWGWWRPAALLPAEAAQWERERLRLVLRHELAHVRRGDCLTQALAAVVCALYWFNPLAWLAAARMRVERERACDDLVVALGQTRASDYAGHLLDIARQLSAAPRGALAVARRSGLEQRLRALLDDANEHGGLTRRAAVAVACALAACLVGLAGWRAAAESPGGQAQIHSKWDQELLTVELHDVQIQADHFLGAWNDLVNKYLLRANLYMDATAFSDMTLFKPFSFHKDRTTGKELFAAILTAYPSMTYTQSKETGVIWFHPKRVKYDDILSLKVRIAPGARGVPMYSDVYLPLCKLLAPNVVDMGDAIKMGLVATAMGIDPATGKPPIPYYWFYDVDLPAGVYSAREILDFCCTANPSKAFEIQPPLPMGRQPQPLIIFPKFLLYNNPTPPTESVRFWELELGKPANGTPSLEEVRAAMCDPDPRKRSTASLYVETVYGTSMSAVALIGKADGSDQAIWTALGVEYAQFRDAMWNDARAHYLTELARTALPRLGEDLKKIENPKLALLASLQLTREKQDTSYLDAIVSKHTYTEAEIASIKPDLYRMARSSKAVRDKLTEMKSQVPALSPEALSELENNNLLTLVREETKNLRPAETRSETLRQQLIARLQTSSGMKEKQAEQLAAAAGEQISPEFKGFFDAAMRGDGQYVTNKFEYYRQNHPQYSHTNESDASLRTSYWGPVLEICLAYSAVVAGDPEYVRQFGEGIIQSIPAGSIYFGGTDPGRGLVTAFCRSQPEADPFFTLTQNALADPSYLDYLRRMYGGRIYVPRKEDLDHVIQNFFDDIQKRLAANQLKPGEQVTNDNGHMQIGGQVVVMELNAEIARIIIDRNASREFYIEESFPLDWMYPYLEPHGPILKINRAALPALSQATVQRDQDYWQTRIGQMIGGWLRPETSLKTVLDFVEKTYVRKDLSGFTGNPRFVQDEESQKMFSKLRSTIAGVYAWRVGALKAVPTTGEYVAPPGAERQRMSKAADLAFRQAFALCPSSPEAVFRYADFLVAQGRKQDAISVLETALRCAEPAARDQIAKTLADLRAQKAP